MARATLSVCVLLLAAALAGCTNSSDTATPSPSSSSTSSGLVPPSDYNVTANATPGTGGGSANATAAQWSYENRSGTISGNALVVQNPPPKDEAFTVANGTAELTVNATADGDGVHVTLRPPGCTSSDCEVKVGDASPSGGATTALKQPKEGDWNVHLAVMGGPGPVSSKYDVMLGQETMVLAAGASASSTMTGGNGTSSTTGSSSATTTSGAP